MKTQTYPFVVMDDRPAVIRSAIVYDDEDNEIAVNNGTFVKLDELLDNEREVYSAKEVASSDTGTIGYVASVEVIYDEGNKYGIEYYTNTPGQIVRVIVLTPHHRFTIANNSELEYEVGEDVTVGDKTLKVIEKAKVPGGRYDGITFEVQE